MILRVDNILRCYGFHLYITESNITFASQMAQYIQETVENTYR